MAVHVHLVHIVHGVCVQCFYCKSIFRAICLNTDNDTKLGTNTMIKTFLAPSTKENFKFSCNKCLTHLGRGMMESQTEKVNTLEEKFNNMETKLEEIKDLLNKRETRSSTKMENFLISNIWFNRDRLTTVKAPVPKSVLIVKKATDEEKRVENQSSIETAIMDNNIPVVWSPIRTNRET